MAFQIQKTIKFCVLYSIHQNFDRLLLFPVWEKSFTNWFSSRLSLLYRRLLFKVLLYIKCIHKSKRPQKRQYQKYIGEEKVLCISCYNWLTGKKVKCHLRSSSRILLSINRYFLSHVTICHHFPFFCHFKLSFGH